MVLRGHGVHVTDLSSESIKRARRKAEAFGSPSGPPVSGPWAEKVAGTFDVAISCDNAVAHTLSDEDLLLVARSIRSKLRHRGMLLASVGDYCRVLEERPGTTMPIVTDTPVGKRVHFQAWDRDADGLARTRSTRSSSEKLENSGKLYVTKHGTRQSCARNLPACSGRLDFGTKAWHMPDEIGYYQPVVTARKRRCRFCLDRC